MSQPEMNPELVEYLAQSRKRERKQHVIIIAVFACVMALMVIVVSFSSENSNKKESVKDAEVAETQVAVEKVKTQAEIRAETIATHFSGWDGSHRNLTKFIKDNMNDPDSYDHVETVYWDQGDHLIVRTTFRGNNMFGGKVKNSVKAKVSLDGDVLEILEQMQ